MPRVFSQRSSDVETGICGTICSSSAFILATVAAPGTLPSSAKERWMPRCESCAAIVGICAAGARTITPTAR